MNTFAAASVCRPTSLGALNAASCGFVPCPGLCPKRARGKLKLRVDEMRRLSLHVRDLIVKFAAQGLGPSKIREKIIELEGVAISLFTIRQWITRYRETQKLTNLPRRHLQPQLTPEDTAFIDQCMEQNSEMTATELRHKLQEDRGKAVSKSLVTRERRKLGWVYQGTAYCQLIRDANKIKRKEYCQRCIDSDEQFDNVIFTDETKIQMESSVSRSCRKKGETRKLVSKPKHPYTVSTLFAEFVVDLYTACFVEMTLLLLFEIAPRASAKL